MVKAKIAVCPGMFASKSVKKSEYLILGKVAPGTVLKLIVRYFAIHPLGTFWRWMLVSGCCRTSRLDMLFILGFFSERDVA